MLRMLGVLARLHHWPVLAAAAVLIVVGGIAASDIQERLSSTLSDYSDSGGESAQARQRIERQTGIDVQQGYVLLVRSDGPIDPQAAPPPVVERTVQLLQARGEVRRVIDFSTARDPGMISQDGHHTYVVAQLGKVVEAKVTPQLEQAIANDPQLQGRVTLGGTTVADEQISVISTVDLSRAESIAMPILFLLLFFVFRGVVAALLPLLGGVFALAASIAGIRVLTTFTELSVFALNLVIALGLGLAIDFSLLMVSRYREELAATGDDGEALRRTLASTGRTVLFSAITVSAALATLTVFPIRFVSSMGVAGIIVVAAAALYGLVVLPALLALLGGRVNALAPRRWQRRPGAPSGRWHRWALLVMRRPVVFAVVSGAVLLLCGAPVLAARFTGIDVTVLPQSSSSAAVNRALQHDFAGGAGTPFQIAVQAPGEKGAQVGAYARRIQSLTDVRLSAPPRYLGGSTWEIDGTTHGDPLSQSSLNAVQAVRDAPAPYPSRVSGESADFLDEQHAITGHLPLAAALAAITTLVVLFAMTGSVLLPIKALVMNVLTLSASMGALVWIFQQGHGAALLGFTPVGALDNSAPLVAVAVAFGLSTDYGVFLLGRITEEHQRGRATRDAVATGLERTGRIVTSAAILLCVATGALALSRLGMIKELGLGITFAVLVDASIVRAILVPSLMAMLGSANWWAPAPLRRLRGVLRLDRDGIA